MTLAAIFLFLFSLILTLSPAVRYRSWIANYHWLHWIGYLTWLIGFHFIHKTIIQTIKGYDPFLLPVLSLLMGWGLLTIWRLDYQFGIRQTLWSIISFTIAIFLFKKKGFFEFLRHYQYLWVISGLILLTLTLFFGINPGGQGPKLWLGCCGLYFQPSEPLKLLFIIFLTAYLSENMLNENQLLHTLTPTLLIFITALGILIRQHDLGTAFIFIVIYIAIIFLVTEKKRSLFIGSLIVLATAIYGYLTTDLIRSRVLYWLIPWADSGGHAYQTIQSIIAIAAGGVFGSGIGLGSPGVIPIAHSDFIFSTIAEETGLIGTIGLITLIAFLMYRGIKTSLNAPTKFQRYLAAGITIYLTAQSILIISGNIRLLPITGIPLPLISYGGSSLITSFLSVIILGLINTSSKNQRVNLFNTKPIFFVSSLFLIAFLIIGSVIGWWAYIRADDLQTRTDNPRLALADKFVPRGSILDQNEQPLVVTIGNIGSLERLSNYPPLSTTTGYNHIRFGRAGLELSLNDYLRGEKGYPASKIWFTHLVYDQPPPGLNVRLTINLELQEFTDSYIQNFKGAAVVMNAITGEILALSSHPHFNPNSLNKNWGQWIESEDAPFLNRAVQGAYPLGPVTIPFLLTKISKNTLQELPPSLGIYYKGDYLDCNFSEKSPRNLYEALKNGCYGALSKLSSMFQNDELIELFSDLGFFINPDIGLPTNQATSPDLKTVENLVLIGDNQIRVSPIQIARAATAISNQGNLANPILTAAVKTELQGWVILPIDMPKKVIPISAAQEIEETFASQEIAGWEFTTITVDQEGIYSWYLGGTPGKWQGTPVVIVIVLEEKNPAYVKYIGRQIIKAAYAQ